MKPYQYYVITAILPLEHLKIIEEVMNYTLDNKLLDKICIKDITTYELSMVYNYFAFNYIDKCIIDLNDRLDLQLKFKPRKDDYVARGLLAGVNVELYNRPGFSKTHMKCLFLLLKNGREKEAEFMAVPYFFSEEDIVLFTKRILANKISIETLEQCVSRRL